jgi:hypothetical protein
LAASLTPFDVQEVHLSRLLLAASNSKILKSFIFLKPPHSLKKKPTAVGFFQKNGDPSWI